MTISDYDVSIRQSYQLSAQAQLIAADEDFSREGYVISAWTENADGTGKRYAPEAVLSADEVSADIQLWAQWKKLIMSYRYPVYNTASDPASGIKEWKTEWLADGEYTLVQNSSSRVTWSEGWHVIRGNVTINGGADCSGAVKLLLTDGCKLTIQNVANSNAGIKVSDDGNSSLAIYGQALGTGALNVTGGDCGAGIGGGREGAGSDITINGGTVTATGGEMAAGIGGGCYETGSDITINGGVVTATCSGAYAYSGAGIGGGCGGTGKNITINGGIVTAAGGDIESAGIGGGDGLDASNIKVSASLIVRADGDNPPRTVIAHDTGEDIASKLTDKRYTTVTPA